LSGCHDNYYILWSDDCVAKSYVFIRQSWAVTSLDYKVHRYRGWSSNAFDSNASLIVRVKQSFQRKVWVPNYASTLKQDIDVNTLEIINSAILVSGTNLVKLAEWFKGIFFHGVNFIHQDTVAYTSGRCLTIQSWYLAILQSN
jgi:hypothetical protein